MILFINKKMKFPAIGKLTTMEKVWFGLVVLFCLMFIIGALCNSVNLALFAIIGGFIMNMIMLILCSSNLNKKIKSKI